MLEADDRLIARACFRTHATWFGPAEGLLRRRIIPFERKALGTYPQSVASAGSNEEHDHHGDEKREAIFSDILDLKSGNAQKLIMLRNLKRALEDISTLAGVTL